MAPQNPDWPENADRPKNPDWFEWHSGYKPGSQSHLVRRLAVVQAYLRDVLAALPSGPIRIASLCAGQGDDVLGVLADHQRAGDVTALLVENDPRNVKIAQQSAEAAGLDRVVVVCADAGNTTALADIVPVDILLLCGMLGNITMADVETTIAATPELLAVRGTVIWTRRSVPNDMTPRIRAKFAATGFTEIGFVNPDADKFTVGCQRLDVPPRSFVTNKHLFDFIGYPTLIERGE